MDRSIDRDDYLVWKDLPYYFKSSLKEHEVTFASIHLKPGDWKPGSFEALTEEEREIVRKAWDIMRDKLEIKEGEEIEPEKIH